MEYSQKPYRRIRLDAMTEMEGKTRLRFQTRMAALLRQEAVAALKDAKAAHDALEAVYNPYVDFDGVRAAAAMEAGRLAELAWVKRRGCKAKGVFENPLQSSAKYVKLKKVTARWTAGSKRHADLTAGHP